jgi:putative ATPase
LISRDEGQLGFNGLNELKEAAGSNRQKPLAGRMRPRTLEQFMGQEHLLAPGRVLERAIRADLIPSMILWGPPGIGKTSLASIIAEMTEASYRAISAVTAGVGDLRQIAKEAHTRLAASGQRTILFIDEVHRFSKSQQDVILPHVENGTLIFIGATTENPSFEVIAPLLSRCTVFTLRPLKRNQLLSILQRALDDKKQGLGLHNVVLEPDALELVIEVTAGDARGALNGVELAASVAIPDKEGKRVVTRSLMEESLQRRIPIYDKKGEAHYSTISAYIKSVRASDPDAAIYWLARMIEAGEDPLFIARRMVILASEDIGLADPQGLVLAVAVQQAVHFLGMPEGAIPLAEATIYLALAPKSNSAYRALNNAIREVRTGYQYSVPLHLRNAVTNLMRDLGYGNEYKYSHDYLNNFSGQINLPPELEGKRFFEAGNQGQEVELRLTHEERWGISGQDGEEAGNIPKTNA